MKNQDVPETPHHHENVIIVQHRITYAVMMICNYLQRLLAGILVLSLVSSMSTAAPRRQDPGDSLHSASGIETELRNAVTLSDVAVASICGSGFIIGEDCGLDHTGPAAIGVSCCSCILGDAATIGSAGQELAKMDFGFYAVDLSENHPLSLLKPPRI